MKFVIGAVFLCLLISSVVAVRHGFAAQQSITQVGPIENVTFGTKQERLINAPNGHISFQKSAGGYRIWVPGRLNNPEETPTPTPSPAPTATPKPNIHEEGGFLFEVSKWPPDVLREKPMFVLGHVVDENAPNCGSYIFDRNYAALNAVVPGAENGTLLGFYDAEYHVACTGQPFLSSIGVATSTDGGVTWHNQNQIIQGLDEANNGEGSVTDQQLSAFHSGQIFDSGASGPSAVVNEADGYVYLYYADRTPITGGPDSIYVARALPVSDAQAQNLQKWNGETWGAIDDQKAAAPILVPSALAGIALQPHVSWNTALHAWLMVFKTAIDFEVATSMDGLHWNQPVSLFPFSPSDNDTGFPTLISIDGGETSQQVTDSKVWLYYSSLGSTAKQYKGHRVPFTLTNATSPVTTSTIVGPLGLNGWYTGPTIVGFALVNDLFVVKTEYSLDNGATWTTGNSVSLNTSGVYNIEFRSADVEGNVEPTQSITVNVDSEPPAITESASVPILPENVRVVHDTISGTIKDNLSGIEPNSLNFAVRDSYGEIHPSGPLMIAGDGSYSFTVALPTFVRAADTSRLFTITVSAADYAGNSYTSVTTVVSRRFKPPPCAPHCV